MDLSIRISISDLIVFLASLVGEEDSGGDEEEDPGKYIWLRFPSQDGPGKADSF